MGVPAGSIFQTTVEYQMWGQTLLNVLHYRVLTEAIEPLERVETQQLATFLADAVTAGKPLERLRGLVSSSVTIVGVKAQVIRPERYAYREASTGAPGLRAANNNTALQASITKRTDFTGRNRQGGVHLPPGGADDYEEGLLSLDYLADLEVGKDFLINDITVAASGGVYRPVLLHPPTAAPQWDDVTAADVQIQSRVMSRRVVGRGI